MDPVEHAITVVNDSLESMVFVLYDVNDTLQIQGLYKHDISSNARYSFFVPFECTLMLHVYQHGLFGLISPRTRMSSGYGFPLQTSNAYRVNIIDSNNIITGNRISVHNESQQFQTIFFTSYRFGDMILKPAAATLVTAGAQLLYGIDANMYRDWRVRRRRKQLQQTTSRTETDNSGGCNEDTVFSISPSCGEEPIDERELWGIFFEQVYLAGRWALDERVIGMDDVEGQDAFLFIGLPSVSLCNVVLRSLKAAEGTLILVDGRSVCASSCPSSFVDMFSKLLQTVSSLRNLSSLDEGEIRWVRQFLLVAGSDKEITGNLLNT